MRVMAVDYGDVRTGIAISDAGCIIAGETLVIRETDRDMLAAKLLELAAQKGVGDIVIGYPLNMDASRGERAEKAEILAEILRKSCPLNVVLQDERRTTVDAHRILKDVGKNARKRKDTVDAVAAALILETYLSFINMKRGASP